MRECVCVHEWVCICVYVCVTCVSVCAVYVGVCKDFPRAPPIMVLVAVGGFLKVCVCVCVCVCAFVLV